VKLTYLVETDWAVHWLRGNKDVIHKLRQFQKQGIGLSVISLAELYTGIYYSTDIIKARERLDDFLSFVSILGMNQDICDIFGRENVRLRKEGLVIGDFDLLIAATCIHYGLKLLTNNRHHFQRIKSLEIISTEE